jgi:hypothetical protein
VIPLSTAIPLVALRLRGLLLVLRRRRLRLRGLRRWNFAGGPLDRRLLTRRSLWLCALRCCTWSLTLGLRLRSLLTLRLRGRSLLWLLLWLLRSLLMLRLRGRSFLWLLLWLLRSLLTLGLRGRSLLWLLLLWLLRFLLAPLRA